MIEDRSEVANDSHQDFQIPASCPFTISEIQFNHSHVSSTWLIREHDIYGEYPHIYAKFCINGSKKHGVIVLSDTGCGTEVPNPQSGQSTQSKALRQQPLTWNIRTFLEYTINPHGLIPYLVMTTHCHYDHILGIGKLPATLDSRSLETDSSRHGGFSGPLTRVLSSAKGQSFVTPYSSLQKHSLCSSIGVSAPHYSVSIWAYDFMKVVYNSRGSLASSSPFSVVLSTNITIIHTQGHTPDSLSWYDSDLHLLCVGDSFYTKESRETRTAPWGPEPPMPTIFDLESDLGAWWGQMGKILGFVRETNEELKTEFQVGDLPEEGLEEGEEECYVLVDETGNDDLIDSALRRDPTSKQSQYEVDMNATQTDYDSHFPYQQYDAEAPELAYDAETWLFIDVKPPRVKLCAAHTTLTLDAEHAIMEMKDFMAAVLRDEVPSKRVKDGPRGEERWFWDYALEGTESNYSVLAPLSVIKQGRATVPKSQWASS